MMEKWRETLSRFLEGVCPREELEAVRRRSNLSEETRREIDETVQLAEHLGPAFRSVPIPEGGPARLLAVLHAEPVPSSLPDWPAREAGAPRDEEESGVDPRIEDGLSATFTSIPVPDGALERLLDRFHAEAETLESSWTGGIDLPGEEDGDVRIQFGDAGTPEPGTERDDEIVAPPRRRSGPPAELLDSIPDVRAASRDAESSDEEDDEEPREEPEDPAD